MHSIRVISFESPPNRKNITPNKLSVNYASSVRRRLDFPVDFMKNRTGRPTIILLMCSARWSSPPPILNARTAMKYSLEADTEKKGKKNTNVSFEFILELESWTGHTALAAVTNMSWGGTWMLLHTNNQEVSYAVLTLLDASWFCSSQQSQTGVPSLHQCSICFRVKG